MKKIILNEYRSKDQLSASIGIFDGMHKGHRKILAELKDKTPSAVITFYRHPRKIKTLESFSERLRDLKKLGINIVFAITEKDKIMEMSADDFIEKIVLKLNIKSIVIGSDFRLGKDRQTDAKEFNRVCEKYGITLTIVEVLCNMGKKLSSTDIRKYLEDGDIKNVAELLGEYPEINGVVIKGKGNGAKLGFKTANIRPSLAKTIPSSGVYLSITKLDGVSYSSVSFIGVSPTIYSDGASGTLFETHIIDFNKDIRDKKIKVLLLEKLRNVEKFKSLKELSFAIDKDIQLAVKTLHSYYDFKQH